MSATKPVLRCPRSGLLDRHPAFEGWRPSERREFSSWWLVAGGAALVALAILGLGL